MRIFLKTVFCFDMSQQNFDNFWTDWVTELRLDSNEASFQAVFEYVFISYPIHYLVLISGEQSKIRLFLLIFVVVDSSPGQRQ